MMRWHSSGQSCISPSMGFLPKTRRPLPWPNPCPDCRVKAESRLEAPQGYRCCRRRNRGIPWEQGPIRANWLGSFATTDSHKSLIPAAPDRPEETVTTLRRNCTALAAPAALAAVLWVVSAEPGLARSADPLVQLRASIEAFSAPPRRVRHARVRHARAAPAPEESTPPAAVPLPPPRPVEAPARAQKLAKLPPPKQAEATERARPAAKPAEVAPAARPAGKKEAVEPATVRPSLKKQAAEPPAAPPSANRETPEP